MSGKAKVEKLVWSARDCASDIVIAVNVGNWQRALDYAEAMVEDAGEAVKLIEAKLEEPPGGDDS